MKIHNHVKLLMQKIQEQRCLDENLSTQTDVEIIPTKITSITLSDLFDGTRDDIDSADPAKESKDERINLELEYNNSLKGLALVLPGGGVTDPLSWWQIHEKMLPLLSILFGISCISYIPYTCSVCEIMNPNSTDVTKESNN